VSPCLWRQGDLAERNFPWVSLYMLSAINITELRHYGKMFVKIGDLTSTIISSEKKITFNRVYEELYSIMINGREKL
jgi:hypothetical protein